MAPKSRATVNEAGPPPIRAIRLPFLSMGADGSKEEMSSLLSAATR